VSEAIHITIDGPRAEELRRVAGEAGFESPEEYIEAVIDAQMPATLPPALEKHLLAALDSGPLVEVTAEDWTDIRREAMERRSQRRKTA
jgi:hypothetical protein